MRLMRIVKESICLYCFRPIFLLFYNVFEREDKIVGSSFYGVNYDNNPKYVMDQLIEKYPDVKKVWICKKGENVLLPENVQRAEGRIREIYEYATAKVWIDSHQIPLYLKRGDDQLFIEMYHGGLGIKHIANDVPGREENKQPFNTAENASLFLSNAKFTDDVIRGPLHFSGLIWKTGYPKNDIFVNEPDGVGKKVRDFFGLNSDTKILVYAPTYRLTDGTDGIYNIDFYKVKEALQIRFGGKWAILVHLHPRQSKLMTTIFGKNNEAIIDANSYTEMQELMLASDAFISDYSSCIFEVAMRKIPCFTYAVDFDKYKIEQGVYMDMTELPFPYADDNSKLVENILNFDELKYLQSWQHFTERVGLVETGHAANDVADFIGDFICEGKGVLDRLKTRIAGED